MTDHRNLAPTYNDAASAEAPVVYFDIATPFGTTTDEFKDVMHVTLDAFTWHVGSDGKLVSERKTVAHLRFGRQGYATLKEAVDGIALMAMKAQGGKS